MFKSKINPEELGTKTYKDYVVILKKEIKKAQKFGRSNVVVLSHFKFACETTGTMMIIGKFGGPLAKWYKKIRKERAMEKDFAMGDCFFEPQDDGSTKLHIALKQGKGKPNHMTKNGKKMFRKLGFLPNIFKGELPENLVGENEGEFTNKELEIIDDEAKESNETKTLAGVYKQYTTAFKQLANQIVPRLKMSKEEAAWDPKHLDIARNVFMLSKSFLDKFDESEDKQQEKFEAVKAKVIEKQPMLQKIAAKVKNMFETLATTDGSVNNDVNDTEDEQLQETLEEVANAVADMRKQLDELTAHFDQKTKS